MKRQFIRIKSTGAQQPPASPAPGEGGGPMPPIPNVPPPAPDGAVQDISTMPLRTPGAAAQDISAAPTFPSIPSTPPPQEPVQRQPPIDNGLPEMPRTLPQTPRPVQTPQMPETLPQTPPPPVEPPKDGKPPRKKRRFPIWARVLVAVLAVLLLILAPGVWYYETNLAAPLSQMTGQKATDFETSNSNKNDTKNNGDILSGGRVNILLLGSDNDGKNDAPLAQTDIVVTIDPTTKYVGMLSIPRDMRLMLPNYGYAKMDAAFSTGYANGHNGKHADDPHQDGAGLAIATIKENFNITIDDYAWVGLDGFVKVVDTAGGVDLEALHPTVDDTYPNDVNSKDVHGYKRLYIAPGPQHMNGVQALEYVRSRHSDLVGDFGRSVRQQQLLNALKAKIQGVDVVSKVPEYLTDLKGHLLTSMDSTEIIKLANFARDLDTTTIHRLVLGPPYSYEYKPDNLGDFIPICEKITPDLQQMFGKDAVCPTIPATPLALRPPTQASTMQSMSSPSTAETQPMSSQPTSMLALSGSVTRNLNLSQRLSDPLGVNSLLDLLFMVTCEDIKV